MEEAEGTIRKALTIEEEPSYWVLLGEILAARGELDQANEVLQSALSQFAPVEELNDWELGWLHTVASHLQNQDVLEAVKAEQRRRHQRADKPTEPNGWLPEISPALRKV